MLFHSNSWAYCNFGQGVDDLKYLWYDANTSPVYHAGSNFWDQTQPIFTGPAWTAGTRTGLIDVGPYPGTFSLHLKQASPIWAGSFYLGPTRQASWIVGLWVYPINFSGQHTILVWQNSDDAPNYGSTFSLGITQDGHIQLMQSANPNINVAPAYFDPAHAGGVVVLTSDQVCAINVAPPTAGSLKGWTHISVVLSLQGAGTGSAKLYVNGCNDAQVSGLTVVAANLLTLMWLNPSGPDEICLSQYIVCDSTGTHNNSNVSQFATIQTPFPNSDAVAQWLSTAGSGYGAVNSNPGPGSNYIYLPSLANPNELFGITPASAVTQVVAVTLNLSLLAATQSVAGLFHVSGKAQYPITPSILPLVAGQITRQAISELNPWTGSTWNIADINSTTWGVRGISGIDEQMAQFFLEVIGQSGPAMCGGSYAY